MQLHRSVCTHDPCRRGVYCGAMTLKGSSSIPHLFCQLAAIHTLQIHTHKYIPFFAATRALRIIRPQLFEFNVHGPYIIVYCVRDWPLFFFFFHVTAAFFKRGGRAGGMRVRVLEGQHDGLHGPRDFFPRLPLDKITRQ